jgi:hypothetical protein
VEMLIEVTEFQRPRRFGSRTTMPSVDVDGGLTFEPAAGATRMIWSWEVRPSGRLRLLGPRGGSSRAPPGAGNLDRAQGPSRGVWHSSCSNGAVITTYR